MSTDQNPKQNMQSSPHVYKKQMKNPTSLNDLNTYIRAHTKQNRNRGELPHPEDIGNLTLPLTVNG